MTTPPLTEAAMLLAPARLRARVEAYHQLLGAVGEMVAASVRADAAAADVLNDPATTDEERDEAKALMRRALRQLQETEASIDTEEVKASAPTDIQLLAYTVARLAEEVAALRADLQVHADLSYPGP